MMEIVEVEIAKLKPSEYNPRKMTEKEASDLEESVDKFGLVEPIVVNQHPTRENVVVGGHQRLLIASRKGFTSMPVVYVSLELERERELNLRLNKNLGQWDWDLLANFNEEELLGVGFTSQELDKIFQLELGEKDDEIPKVEESICKEGDLWRLERHKLLCDDSTKKENIGKLMNGGKADMVFTDPPYGINLNTDFKQLRLSSKIKFLNQKNPNVGKSYNKVIGDEISYNPQPIFDNFGYCKEVFLWGADYFADKLLNRNNGCWMVWDKTEGGISPNSDYDKMYGSNFELCWSRGKHKRQIVRCLWKSIFGLSKEDIKQRVHPTQKPVRLCEWFIEKFSKREQNIVDLFGGSGSTLIACEKLNRNCYMMEIDHDYCDMIIRRWESFTGKKAIKL